MAASVIYVLCAILSVGCAAALLLVYYHPHRQPGRLVMWSSACFVWLALSNTLMASALRAHMGNELTAAVLNAADERRPYTFVLRLIALITILTGILVKDHAYFDPLELEDDDTRDVA